jgi:hypothetical protein
MSTPITQDLGTIITSAKVRKTVYSAFVLALIAVGGTQVAYSALQLAQPSWLVAALAVLAYLGIPVGTLAISNTPSKAAVPTTPPVPTV